MSSAAPDGRELVARGQDRDPRRSVDRQLVVPAGRGNGKRCGSQLRPNRQQRVALAKVAADASKVSARRVRGVDLHTFGKWRGAHRRIRVFDRNDRIRPDGEWRAGQDAHGRALGHLNGRPTAGRRFADDLQLDRIDVGGTQHVLGSNGVAVHRAVVPGRQREPALDRLGENAAERGIERQRLDRERAPGRRACARVPLRARASARWSWPWRSLVSAALQRLSAAARETPHDESGADAQHAQRAARSAPRTRTGRA